MRCVQSATDMRPPLHDARETRSGLNSSCRDACEQHGSQSTITLVLRCLGLRPWPACTRIAKWIKFGSSERYVPDSRLRPDPLQLCRGDEPGARSSPHHVVAERPGDGSRGLQPTEGAPSARRVATRESFPSGCNASVATRRRTSRNPSPRAEAHGYHQFVATRQ